MARTKINPDELHRYLDAGHSQADAAKYFNVSEAAISQRVQKLRIATSEVVALEKAGEVVDQKLSATQRLQRVQQVILDQLSWAEEQTRQPDADRGALADVIVKLSAEVRAQLRLEHDVSRTLIDLRVVREFQQGVIQTIADVDPSVAQQIVAKLKERRALRASGSLPALDGQGGFDVA